VSADPSFDFRNPASKARVLTAMRRQADAIDALASVPEHWNMSTACEGWEVRDMVGHLVDAIESYLDGFQVARGNARAPTVVGVADMARVTDAAARAFRNVSQHELLARFRERFALLASEFDTLSNGEWTTLLVVDKYLGPLPAMVAATGLLGGLTVHAWDIREGLGLAHMIAGDDADLLVPFVFLLWRATADTSAVDAPYAIGIVTTGANGGDTRVDVTADGLHIAPGDVRDCRTTLEFDPATLVLSAYGRTNAGTIRGDAQLAGRFRSLFRSI
jgi:uncharacterized protein (TIGR03083 family)